MNYQLLPEDVMLQILSKLPANSVIRFKCVCKSWKTLLEDHSFIQKHTMNITENTMMIRNPNLDHLLVSCRDKSTNKRVIISMSSTDSSSSSLLISRFIINEKKQLIPSSFNNNNYGQMRLIGPCNGIVCIYGYHDQIALCNPTIGDFKTLPFSTIKRPNDMNIRGGDVGLGYDSNTNDYKVIQILFCISIHHNNNNNNRRLVYNQVEIYSLSTNSWRKYDSRVPPYSYHIMQTSNIWSMVYKNKTFCWWAKNDDDMEMILSFDMEKEVFQETPPLPLDIDEEFGREKRTTRAIMPWKEKIGLVVYCMKEVEKFFDLWVVNGDDVLGANWTKVSRIGGVVGVERPLGFWKNSHELVLESSSRELVLYDLNSKEISNLGIYGKRDRLEVLVYIPTLVSLNQYK